MCGIVGYVGRRKALPILIDCLKRLEYRGYDSAGIAIVGNGIQICKDKGEIRQLEKILPDLEGVLGIAHTRWATHGQPTKENAHPFLDCSGKMALVHNGIIENFVSLEEELKREGHIFTSQTDTESVVHLVEKNYDGDLEEAVRKALPHIQGTYAFAFLHAEEPNKIVVARKESPLILGVGAEENFVASDVPALLKETNKVIYIMDGEIASLTPKNIKIMDFQGKEIKRDIQTITWSIEDAEKGGFEHFMEKEIFEEPEAIRNTLLGRLTQFDINSFLEDRYLGIKIIACGTSYHAGLTGKYIIEDLAKIPTTAEMASEYRYSSPSYDKPLVVLISQSGETADTLGAAREARKRGCTTLAITNYVGSSLTREAHHVIYTRAGLEIGVAATKTFIAQLTALYLIAIQLGIAKGTLEQDEANHLKEDLRTMPRVVQKVLNEAPKIEEVASRYCRAKDMFFIGRNINYPIALEGALKLKEISYVHAEGYSAGELKHGPLALITPETPIVAIAVKDRTYEKMLGNIGEVSARGSPVIAVGFEGDKDLQKYVDDVIYVPQVGSIFSPIPVTVALQLFAYYVARERGSPIDKPRHLAKSVTVE